MVTFVDISIADDPTLRRLELLEVVLTNCANRMWKMVPEKKLKAPSWVKKVRDAVRAQKSKLSVHKHDGTATPSKAGSNGLYVASADAIVCKQPSAPVSQHDSLCGLPQGTESLLSREKLDGSPDARSHFPRDGDALPTASRSSDGACSDRPVDGSPGRSSPLTAATTMDGDVVLVSSSGKQTSDTSVMREDDIVPDIPLKIKRLSGGITNELFHVFDEENPSTSVVVRIFGKETERVISRESELFYQSLFVETFVRGGNFLVYEFLHNYETLPFQDMGVEMIPIADRIADFHVRSTVAARLDFKGPQVAEDSWKEVPVEQEMKKHCAEANHDGAGIVTNNHNGSHVPGRSRFEREMNCTRKAFTAWADLIQSTEIVEKVQVDKRAKFVELAAQMKAECAFYLDFLDKHDRDLGEGACHNDLLAANFMRHRTNRDIKIIDFDYTTRNYLLFDLANHFNEYTGLDCDYKRFYPSQEHIRTFVAHYRQSMRAALDAAHASLTPDQKKTLKGCIIPRERELFWTSSPEEEEACVKKSVELVNLLAVYSNMFWAMWSLVQEAVSTLDVDFLDYSELRFRRAMETKEAAFHALAPNS